MALFDATDKQRIESAIAELERQTAAEVVVAVVPHSGRPWLARSVVAFAFGLAAALLYLARFTLHDPLWALFVELGAAAGAFALFGWQPFERVLVAPHVAERAVMEHAFLLFARRGLYRTRGHTGVLVLLSELERRVVILGDEAIHARVGEDGWRTQVERIVAGIKSGEAARGVLEVLVELTPKLAEIAPVSGPNDNELPNAVLEES